MRKPRLKLDARETFHTGQSAAQWRGMVDAHAAAARPRCRPAPRTDLACRPCTPML